MGTNMLFKVSASLFNIAQLLKYMDLGECCFQGQRHFPKHFTEALRLVKGASLGHLQLSSSR